MRRTLLIALITLLLGLLVGYFIGRFKLDSEWRQPRVQLGKEAAELSAGSDANATPKEGTRVFRAMPVERTRLAARELTANDPLVVTIGSVGRDDEKTSLHLTLKNQGKCRVTAYQGVAYGFDAFGRPAKLNRMGEHYVAFSAKPEPIEPGTSAQLDSPLRLVDNASLVVAHVDRVSCEGGPDWVRP